MAPIIFYHNALSGPSRFVLLVFRSLGLDVEVGFCFLLVYFNQRKYNKIVKFQIRNIDLRTQQQLTPEFIKINPQHTVPTIDDNGFILWESNAIAQYLVETYAPESPLYPKDTKERAIVNQRLQFYMGTLLQRIRAIIIPIIKEGEKNISDLKKIQLYEALGYTNGYLEGNDWVAGNHVTLADLAIFVTVSTIVSFGADVSEYKYLGAWLERCKVLPGFDENADGVRTFTAVFKSLYDGKI